MATVNYTAGACPALLLGLGEIMNQNDPKNLVTPVGFAQALLDPANRATAQFEQLGAGEGHSKTVRIAYKQPSVISEVGDTKDCDPGEKKPRLETIATANMHAQHAIRVDEADVRKLCESFGTYQNIPVSSRGSNGQAQGALQVMSEIAGDIMLSFDAMRQKINLDLLAAAALEFGTFRDGSASKSIEVLKTDHSPYLKGFNILKQEIARSTFQGQPITFGEGLWDLANMSLQYGCCNDGGTDFGTMARNVGFKFYRDLQAGTALGNIDAFGAFMPGTMHMLAFNDYVGEYARPHGTMVRGTLPDPALPGLRYDFRLLPNECGEYYDLFLNLNYGLWAADNLFKAESTVGAGDEDPRFGMNGVFKFIAQTAA